MAIEWHLAGFMAGRVMFGVGASDVVYVVAACSEGWVLHASVPAFVAGDPLLGGGYRSAEEAQRAAHSLEDLVCLLRTGGARMTTQQLRAAARDMAAVLGRILEPRYAEERANNLAQGLAGLDDPGEIRAAIREFVCYRLEGIREALSAELERAWHANVPAAGSLPGDAP